MRSHPNKAVDVAPWKTFKISAFTRSTHVTFLSRVSLSLGCALAVLRGFLLFRFRLNGAFGIFFYLFRQSMS